MLQFKADLHIHTVLSPCGDLEMSPRLIVDTAIERQLDIIGITDHNSLNQVIEISKYAKQKGLVVYFGVEICTKEEIHCVCFVKDLEKLQILQNYLDENLPDIINDPDIFGYQVWVDQNDDILGIEEKLLISAINKSIDEVEAFVHSLGGVFIPAHIDKNKNSVISQLGFIPFDLNVDALEVSWRCDLESFRNSSKQYKNKTFIKSSDAHYLNDIARSYTIFEMENRSFEEFCKALKFEDGRRVIV